MTTVPDFNKIKSILLLKNGINIKEIDQLLELPLCSKENYYAIRTSLGYLLNVIQFTIKNTQIISKFSPSVLCCKNFNECNSHKIKDFMEWVKNHVKKLGEITKNIEEFVTIRNYVHCVRKSDRVDIYFTSNPTNHADGSIDFLKIFLFKTLQILELLHNSDFKLGDTELISSDYLHSNFHLYSIISFLRYVSYNLDNEFTALGKIIEMLWYTHRPADKMPDDMKDFVDKCNTDSKLLASELLKHRFLQGEKKILNNDIKSRLNIDFKILKQVGKGAFGKVIMAKHQLDNQLYAIKRVPIKNDKEFNEKTKEIDLLARLTHENVVRYYNSWTEEATQDDFDDSSSDVTGSEETDQSINQIKNSLKSVSSLFHKVMCIQMEFCEKSTLLLAINNDLSIDRKRRLLLFNGIRNGLSYIHSQNIIHRDLNPRNIFINSNDQIKIGDFGQATTPFLALKSKFTNKTDPSQVGTSLYVAPELMENTFSKTYDKFVDLYSLGIIYFEMCNPPFKTQMERCEKIKALRDGKINLPESDEYHIIKALVEKDVSQRMILCKNLLLLY